MALLIRSVISVGWVYSPCTDIVVIVFIKPESLVILEYSLGFGTPEQETRLFLIATFIYVFRKQLDNAPALFF